MQDKVIERFKDELKAEQIEKHKLIQFKMTKVKRLNLLENMARRLEVLQVVDVDKIVQSLMVREQTIKTLKKQSCETQLILSALYKAMEKDIKKIRKKATNETKMKEAAIVKMDELRQEIMLL